MSTKIKYQIIFISLLSPLILLNNGCGKSNQNQVSLNSENEVQQMKPLLIPQYEVIETPKYKQLKKQFDKAKAETDALVARRMKLEILYTEQNSLVKEARKNCEESRKKLDPLEKALNEEYEKLEKQIVSVPV